MCGGVRFFTLRSPGGAAANHPIRIPDSCKFSLESVSRSWGVVQSVGHLTVNAHEPAPQVRAATSRRAQLPVIVGSSSVSDRARQRTVARQNAIPTDTRTDTESGHSQSRQRAAQLLLRMRRAHCSQRLLLEFQNCGAASLQGRER